MKMMGFVTTFKSLGQLRALVSVKPVGDGPMYQSEDFVVPDECRSDLKLLWRLARKQSSLLRGRQFTEVMDDSDETIEFEADGVSEDHLQAVSQLRSAVGMAATILEHSARDLLEADPEKVDVEGYGGKVADLMRDHANRIERLIETFGESLEQEAA